MQVYFWITWQLLHHFYFERVWKWSMYLQYVLEMSNIWAHTHLMWISVFQFTRRSWCNFSEDRDSEKICGREHCCALISVDDCLTSLFIQMWLQLISASEALIQTTESLGVCLYSKQFQYQDPHLMCDFKRIKKRKKNHIIFMLFIIISMYGEGKTNRKLEIVWIKTV